MFCIFYNKSVDLNLVEKKSSNGKRGSSEQV